MRGDAHLSATRRFWRTVIVASLSAFVLGATQPNILAAISGISEGTFGVTLDYIGVVTRVTPGLPAARAGISPGDQIEPVSFGDRMTAFESPISVPGTPMRAVVKHGDSARTLTLTSVAIGQNATVLITVIKRLTALAFILVGAGLLLLRPSRMTWGLFLFALSSNGTAGALYFHIFGPGVFTPIEFTLALIYAAGPLGLWIFASRFPNDDAPGWRKWFDTAAPWLAPPLLLTVFPLWRYLFTGQPYGPAGHWFSNYFAVVVETVGILIRWRTTFRNAVKRANASNGWSPASPWGISRMVR